MTNSELSNINILGNGLLAKSFKGIKSNSKIYVLASGVSNSQETDKDSFKKEFQLLKNTILNNKDYHHVYFSTCSINCNLRTSYVMHKKNMEEMISKCAPKYSIFRIPQIVGVVNNKTIVSDFVRRIINKEPINIQKRSTRNIIDVDDISRIVMSILGSQKSLNNVINISTPYGVSPKEIALFISKFLKISPTLIENENGYEQRINIDLLLEILNTNDKIFQSNYWKTVLIKYVPILKKLHEIKKNK